MTAASANDNCLSKEEILNAIIMDSLKDFIEMFDRKHSKADIDNSRHKLEDPNAYTVVRTSLISKELNATKLTRTLSHKLGILHRQIKGRQALRNDLHDKDVKNWIWNLPAVPKHARGLGSRTPLPFIYTFVLFSDKFVYTSDHRAEISEFLHSNKCR